MAIPQHTIDQILDRVDIVDLIGQRVKLKKSGRTYSGCCPFHQEKSPSFHVYRDKAYYHCFGCQANGNAIKFLMELESRSFIDVIKDLSQQTGVELPKDDFKERKVTYQRQTPPAVTPPTPPSTLPDQPVTEAEPVFHPVEEQFAVGFFDPAHTAPAEEVTLYDLLENITQYYQQQLQHAPHAQNYFQNRALTEKTIQEWRLGYAPSDWRHLQQAFPRDIEGLKILGLVRDREKGSGTFSLLRDRVIFPIRDSKGRVVGFGGRALNDEIKPKYINSPESEIFHKNRLLYGLYEGRKSRAQDWLMVEGYMDVIALHQSGISGAVATLGTASNSEHLNILFKQNPRLTLAFDGDHAGQKAAWRTLEIALPLLEDGRELRFFILPEQHDPDSLIRQEGLESFQQLFAQAPLLSDFLFAQLSKRYDIKTPESKGMIMAELRQLSQNLPNGSYKYLLSQSFRERLGFGRKQFDQALQDKDLSFSSIDRTQLLIALLIHYPVLFPHFETLRAYAPKNSLSFQLLDTLNLIYENLPKDIELSRFYILGACHHFMTQIVPILNRINLEEFLQLENPEEVDRHAQGLFKQLEDYFLKLKKPSSIQEAQNLKILRYEVRKSLNRTEIKNVF